MPNLTIPLLAALVSLIIGAIGGFFTAHEAGQAELKGLEFKYAAAKAEAIQGAILEQHRIDQVALDAALALDHQVQVIEVGTVTLVKEIETHVKTTSIACVPYGFVRVLDAEVLGRDAADLALPAGITDDSCAPVDAIALARSIAANYGTARANAAQLDAVVSVSAQWEDKASLPRPIPGAP